MMMSGCRISQQLREYNPRQLGICSFNGRKHGCFYCNKASQAVTLRPLPLWPRKFSFCPNDISSSKRFMRFKLLDTNASYSSWSVTNNSDDLTGLSFVNKDNCTQDTSQDPVLTNCLSPAENGENPPSERVTSVAGGIVALGKFDALHIGHRELAIQAARMGVPFLMSFVGMAKILGWEPRAPIVAKCDRKRVLSTWAPFCGNIIPKEYHVEFSKVRNLPPQQFVEKLAKELGVHGVVAGQNYRFGYRAAGDASDLVRLCKDYGMSCCIINPVMDKNREFVDIGSNNSEDQGQVSSTRVRHALANGDMKYVSELLGRPHRLILTVENKELLYRDGRWLSARRSCLMNLPPKEGDYKNCSLVIMGDENVVPCRVIVDATDIYLELDELAPHKDTITAQNLLGIDFDDSQV